MDVLITGKGVEIDSTLKAYIRRRIDFALSRFSTRVGHVRVVVANKSGHFGGIEKLCRIRVQLLGNTTVAVSSSNDDVHVVIAHAADQIHSIVARRIEMGRILAVTKRIDRDRIEK